MDMPSNLGPGNIVQTQTIVAPTVIASPTVNVQSQVQQVQQLQQQTITNMEVDSNAMNSASPALGLGNLQSVVGNAMPAPTTITQATAVGGGSQMASVLQTPPTASKAMAAAAPPPPGSESQVVTRARLHDLVREVDATEQLDEEVEDLLMQLADDFVETTLNAACLMAKHRRAPTVEVKDVQLYLERQWNMWIPGFGTDELRQYKRAPITEAHKQRLALIRKTIKKF